MKTKIKNCLITTALSILLLAAIAAFYHARFLLVAGIFQTLLANIVIHLGLTLLQHFESKYFIVEIFAEIGYVLVILLVSGGIFNWYSSTPVWILVFMGIAIYAVASVFDVFRIRNDIFSINQQLTLDKEENS